MLILKTGLRVCLGRNSRSSQASVEGQSTGHWGRAPGTFSVGRAARAVGPTIWVWLYPRKHPPPQTNYQFMIAHHHMDKRNGDWNKNHTAN